MPNINDNDVIWFGVINTFNKKGVNKDDKCRTNGNSCINGFFNF